MESVYVNITDITDIAAELNELRYKHHRQERDIDRIACLLVLFCFLLIALLVTVSS